jgi:alpha-tubulin suppressor-like RCC1 family protein
MSGRWLLGVLLLHGCSEVVGVLDQARGAGGSAARGGGGSDSAGRGGAAEGGEPDMSATSASGAPDGGGAPGLDPALGIFVDAGDAHACATRSGALYCWGAGADGRLGLGDTADRDTPTRVGAAADWISVATGVAHTCALNRKGEVWCFGANNVGQLGQGNATSSSVPLRVLLGGKVTQLSSEANTACVVLENHELYCWGRNWEGNIGLNDTHPGVDQLSPIRSGDVSDWQLTGTGDGHTCGIRAGGLLFGWGRNTAANLGLGQKQDQQRRAATQIGTDGDWQVVVSGQDSSCGIRLGNRLFCWGGNSFGNLGLGDTEERLSPTPIEPDKLWVQVAIDTFHACGIDVEDDLYCWGRGIEGQLGTADNDERLAPVRVGQGYAQVAVGRMFTCAVNRAGAVLCTGENAARQLGLGGVMRRNVFSELAFF